MHIKVCWVHESRERFIYYHAIINDGDIMNETQNNIDKLLAERSKLEKNRNGLLGMVSDLSERIIKIDDLLCSSTFINSRYGGS